MGPTPFIVLIVLLILLGLAILRAYLIRRFWNKGGLKQAWARAAAQLSVAMLVVFLLIHPGFALVSAAFPIIPVVWRLEWLTRYEAFFAQIWMGPAVAFAISVAALVLIPKLRRYSLFVILVTTSLGLGLMAERKSRQLMCERALAAGIDELQRNSIFWSLANAPRDLQFELHGLAMIDGQRHGWSYRDLSWYPLEERVFGEVISPPQSCGAGP